MSINNTIISLRALSKRLNGGLVIDIDELEIKSGECVILRGKNGAGKSTLLKIIAGLSVPDSVEVTFDGHSMSWRKAYFRFRKNVVYLHQTPYLFDRTVSENVSYGLRIRGDSKETVRKKVAEALDWAQLSNLSERNARELSGGERQRVALTRARILSPQLLLLDEPTSGMDRAAKDQTFDLINDLVSDGVAVYIAMHEPAHEVTFHRTIELDQGRIINIDNSSQ